MTYASTELLTVSLDRATPLKVGRLASRNRRILFEYDPAFVASGVEISPIKLPLKPGVAICPDMVFDGLAVGAIVYVILPMLKNAFRDMDYAKQRMVYLGVFLGFLVGFIVNLI